MAKNEKIFLKFYNVAFIVRHLKKMHTGLFRAFYFHQQPRYGQKTKKIFLKIYNVALCGIKKCIRAYFLLFSSAAEIWPKTKKIFLKFYNVALCGIQNRCIRAYFEPFIFIRSRDMAKTKKNIFEILQRSIVRH
ncbi:hypothetical protein PUN28_000541 [Cardiocondyla obscurior]|uniref:Uncharacterized protein n=1 Tax=Cardiocondyla obscurior TaxID=286306 RepID=A0AAW2GZZ3_9HYME